MEEEDKPVMVEGEEGVGKMAGGEAKHTHASTHARASGPGFRSAGV